MLAALIGTGVQLALLILSVILITIAGKLNSPVGGNLERKRGDIQYL